MVAPRRLESTLIYLRSFAWSINFFAINIPAIIIIKFFTLTPPFSCAIITSKEVNYMKLNYDCIRDVLLYLEENLELNNTVYLENIKIDYSDDDIKYSILKLEEIEYIKARIVKADGVAILDATIFDITFYGHEFLNTVRPKTVWENTKDVSSKLGVKTISSLTQIATQIVTQLISKQLGL